MFQIIKSNRSFLIPFVIWVVIGSLFYMIYEKGEMVLFFNDHQVDFFNSFFKWVTQLAEGGFIVAFLVGLLIKRYGSAFILSLSLIATTILVYYVKRYYDIPRPPAIFDNLHYIEGVDMHIVYSFPSGHTTAGFVIFTSLALFVSSNWGKFGLFLMACLVGISRVYLMQHFFIDVIVGSVIGVSCTLWIATLIHTFNPLRFDVWKEGNLIQSFTRK